MIESVLATMAQSRLFRKNRVVQAVYNSATPPNADCAGAVETGHTGGAIGAVFVGFATWTALGWIPPLWLQPTAVGVLWGSLFFAGFLAGSLGRGKLSTALVCLIIGTVSNAAFQRITDFASSDSLLVATCLLFAGWLTATLDPLSSPFQSSQRFPSPHVTSAARWTIWDIAFLTLIAACACHSIPKLEAPPMLMLGVLMALLGGLTSSWMACRWAWNERWNLWRFGVVILSLCAAAGLVFLSRPPSMPLLQSLQWVVSGPLNVIAAQALTVLFSLAVLRLERLLASERRPWETSAA